MRTETVDLEKTVAARDSLEDAGSDEVELDYVLIEDGVLDVEAPLTEQLLLALPTKVLCKGGLVAVCVRSADTTETMATAGVTCTSRIRGLPASRSCSFPMTAMKRAEKK